MKTWQAVIANIAMIFGSFFIGKIPDQKLQTATYASAAAVAAALAKANSETDQNGNKLPPAEK